MRINKIVLIKLFFVLLYLFSALPLFAKNADEYLKENKTLAEKNEGYYIKVAYFGTEDFINLDNEIEISDVMKDSPADRAGLKSGDVIFSINGTKIEKKYDFFKKYLMAKPGAKLRMQVRRDGVLIRKEVTSQTEYIPYLTYVLAETLYKNIPVRLAIIVDEVKTQLDEVESDKRKRIEFLTQYAKENALARIESYLLIGARGFSNFTLIDRERTESILNELKFNQSGLIQTDYQSKLGKMLGASHMMFIRITGSFGKEALISQVSVKLLQTESGKVLGSFQSYDTQPYYPSEDKNFRSYRVSLTRNDPIIKESNRAYDDAFNKLKEKKFIEAKHLLDETAIPKLELYLRKLNYVSTPSADLKSAHTILIDGMNLRLEAYKLYKSGIENKKFNLLREGDEKFESSKKKLQEWVEMINQIEKK